MVLPGMGRVCWDGGVNQLWVDALRAGLERVWCVGRVWGGVPACVCVGMDRERCQGVPPVRELAKKDRDS